MRATASAISLRVRQRRGACQGAVLARRQDGVGAVQFGSGISSPWVLLSMKMTMTDGKEAGAFADLFGDRRGDAARLQAEASLTAALREFLRRHWACGGFSYAYRQGSPQMEFVCWHDQPDEDSFELLVPVELAERAVAGHKTALWGRPPQQHQWDPDTGHSDTSHCVRCFASYKDTLEAEIGCEASPEGNPSFYFGAALTPEQRAAGLTRLEAEAAAQERVEKSWRERV